MTRDRTPWKEFGRAIELARGVRGWSQRELAAEAGISPTTLGALERGESDPRSPKVAAVAAALDWPLDAADRWMAGDRSLLHHTTFHSKYDRLNEEERERIERAIDDALGS